MRNDFNRMLLKVVGWQPMVFLAHKSLKEGPDLSGQPAEKKGLFGSLFGKKK